MKVPIQSNNRMKPRLRKTKVESLPFGVRLKAFCSILTITKALLATTLAIFLVVLVSGTQAINQFINVPIAHVEIDGDLQKVSQNALQTIINRSALKGFLGLDLTQLHRDLIAVPWVKAVSIKRVFPNTLGIHIEENTLMAIWNDDAYITASQEVIRVKKLTEVDLLPRLIGTDIQMLLSIFERITENIPETMKPVREVDVSYIGAVRLKLAQDVDLVMDSGLLKEQLTRWVSVYQNRLINDVDRLKSVDLRYENGLAVVFDDKALNNNNKIIIGGRD